MCVPNMFIFGPIVICTACVLARYNERKSVSHSQWMVETTCMHERPHIGANGVS